MKLRPNSIITSEQSTCPHAFGWRDIECFISIVSRSKLNQIAFLILLVLLYQIFPVLVLSLVFFFISTSLRMPVAVNIAAVSIVLGIFGWMNSQKGISGDWTWYTSHYLMLKYRSFSEYFGQRVGRFTIKETEPVYYFISFLITRLTNGSITSLAWTVTTLIYVPTGIAISLLADKLVKEPVRRGAVIIIALMVGITFTLTTHLVRQEIACSLLVCGGIFIYSGRRYFGGGLLLAALLTHNSTLIPIVTLGTAFLYVSRYKSLYSGRLFLLVLLFVCAGQVYIRHGFNLDYILNRKSDGDISKLVYTLDLSIFVFFLYVRRHFNYLPMLSSVIAATAVIYAGFLIGVSPDPLPLLRMYFYVEALRTLMVTYILCSLLSLRNFSLLLGPLIIAAIIYVEIRISVSPFNYMGGVVSHLLRPFAFYL